VVPCDRIRYDSPVPNVRTHGTLGALGELPEYQCAGCGFCGSVELNMLLAGRLDIVPTIARVIARR